MLVPVVRLRWQSQRLRKRMAGTSSSTMKPRMPGANIKNEFRLAANHRTDLLSGRAESADFRGAGERLFRGQRRRDQHVDDAELRLSGGEPGERQIPHCWHRLR